MNKTIDFYFIALTVSPNLTQYYDENQCGSVGLIEILIVGGGEYFCNGFSSMIKFYLESDDIKPFHIANNIWI